MKFRVEFAKDGFAWCEDFTAQGWFHLLFLIMKKMDEETVLTFIEKV